MLKKIIAKESSPNKKIVVKKPIVQNIISPHKYIRTLMLDGKITYNSEISERSINIEPN